MSLATLSTQALAVRKHGGGLAAIQRPTQQAGGHPLRSKGGEINSLCCAAAGIINLLLRAAASHAYPTTCVRRAPFTAAPLRSQNRPHAQLVVGYKHKKYFIQEDTAERPQLRLHLICKATDTLKMGLSLTQVTLKLLAHIPHLSSQIFGTVNWIAKYSDNYSEVMTNSRGDLNALQRQVIIKVPIESIKSGCETKRYVLRKFCNFFELSHKIIYRKRNLFNGEKQSSSTANIKLMAMTLNLRLLTPLLCTGYMNSDKNCPDRTNCLHPCSSALTTNAPLDHCANQQPQGRGDYQNAPYAADSKKAAALQLTTPIHTRLHANQISPSLATLAGNVQKVVA